MLNLGIRFCASWFNNIAVRYLGSRLLDTLRFVALFD